MRLTSSTHNHTNLCDGRNTPDEMARAALEAGFTDFGFSGHSYAPFDLDYSVKSEQHYVQELRALQKAYAGCLRIAVGMEADWFAPVNDRAALDYIIGSVHYLRDEATGRYYAVDGAPVQSISRHGNKILYDTHKSSHWISSGCSRTGCVTAVFPQTCRPPAPSQP